MNGSRSDAVRAYVAAHPRTVDACLAGVLTVFVLTLRLDAPMPASHVRVAVLIASMPVQTVPMLWRRSAPWHVFALACLGYLVGELVDTLPDFTDNVAPVVAAYAVARYARQPASLAAAPLLAIVILLPELANPDARTEPLPWFDAVVIGGICAVVWMFGNYQRRIHTDAARLRGLADRLRAEQRVSAARAVAAERVRIAHELHDLVAHHVSAIAMQAKVMPDNPAAAGIGATADTALTEMRRLLRLLADDRADPGPEPSLRHLGPLTEGVLAAGFGVRLVVDPAAADVPQAVQVSAYRVIQEALTNVLRHCGPTDISIEVTVRDGTLSVTVDNGPPATGHVPAPGSGFGLIGMRERVALFDGTLTAGPQDGGWRVAAAFELVAR